MDATLLLTHACFACISSKNKLNKKKHQFHHRITSISFPKSSLTPVSIPQTPYLQTKHQALDAVIKDLQASMARGVFIDIEIFSSLLETCYKLQSINHGIQIHRLIPPILLRKSPSLSSKLLRLYASCGYIDTAHQLFDEMPKRHLSAFPWNSLISGYAELGQHEDALALYFQMEEEGVVPDKFTFPRALKACAGLGSIQVGEAIHRDIVRRGFVKDVFVNNALVDMYSKCGDIVMARRVFDKIDCRDRISWNSMLTGYIHHGLLVEALDVFRGMVNASFEPDRVAISTILSGFSSSRIGFEVHGWVLRRGMEQNLSIANSLIVFYSDQHKLVQARWLFDMMVEKDIVSWNSIISGHRNHLKALVYFEQMENSNMFPDSVTFVSLLSACAHLGLIEDGKRLFEKMKKTYKIKPRTEHYSCMVNLLGRADFINDAYEIIINQMEFEAGPTVWGALLYSCSVHGNVDIGEIAAERLFDLEPDNVHNFELLIKIYGKAGMWNKVDKVMQSMAERGLDS